MRVVAIGDVGVVDGMMHIGDEAMFEGMAAQLQRRGFGITAVSGAPSETAERYRVQAVPRIGFSMRDGRHAAEQRLRAVVAAAAGDAGALRPEDPAREVIEAVRGATGVAVAGGGNLASTWPQHVYERRALAGIAAALGRPIVVSGQTLGPDLRGRDRELVAELLRQAAAVGLREPASVRLARELARPGARLTATVDDASFLVDADAAPIGRVLVSLSLHLGGRNREAAVRSLARLCDAAAHLTGLPVSFLAHFGSLRPGEVRGDAVLHEEVRAAMAAPSTVRPTTDSMAAAHAARTADLLLTSRYHPAVFAVPAGVPTLGISVDDYTSVKLTGALDHFGQHSVVELSEALGGSAEEVVAAVWADRSRTRADGVLLAAQHRPEWDAWWDLVAERLARS